MHAAKPLDVDAYLAGYPEEIQKILQQVRATIKKSAPEADETISYGMPTFRLNGRPLVYFAAFQNHLGLYAIPNAHEAFKEEFSVYKTGKGSVQFPLTQPMPLDSITRIVEFRVSQNGAELK